MTQSQVYRIVHFLLHHTGEISHIADLSFQIVYSIISLLWHVKDLGEERDWVVTYQDCWSIQ